MWSNSHLQQGSVLVQLRSWTGWGSRAPSAGSAPCGGWRTGVAGWTAIHPSRLWRGGIDGSGRYLRWLDCPSVLEVCGETSQSQTYLGEWHKEEQGRGWRENLKNLGGVWRQPVVIWLHVLLVWLLLWVIFIDLLVDKPSLLLFHKWAFSIHLHHSPVAHLIHNYPPFVHLVLITPRATQVQTRAMWESISVWADTTTGSLTSGITLCLIRRCNLIHKTLTKCLWPSWAREKKSLVTPGYTINLSSLGGNYRLCWQKHRQVSVVILNGPEGLKSGSKPLLFEGALFMSTRWEQPGWNSAVTRARK